MSDLKVAARIGTIFSAEATSNERIELAYPGISAWKITAIGRTARTRPSRRAVSNAVAKRRSSSRQWKMVGSSSGAGHFSVGSNRA